jgi:hypothetical protein
MSHLDGDAFCEFRKMYENRVKVGKQDFDETIGAYMRLLTSRGILNYVMSLTVEMLEMFLELELACGIPSAQARRPLNVLIQGVRQGTNLDLQDRVLQLKGLTNKQSQTLSRTMEPSSVAASPAATRWENDASSVAHRKFLAYVTAVTDDRLGRALEIETAVGVPCMWTLRHMHVLVRVVRELQKVELEDARSRAIVLGVEFPDKLARALEYGDVHRVCKIVDPKRIGI